MIGALSSDLIRQVRSQCREKNVSSITDVDAYDALSRGYDYAMEIVATLYPDPLVESRDVVVSGTAFTLPEDIYSDRILKVLDVSSGSYPVEVDRRSYRDIEDLPIRGNTPEYYVVTGRDVTLYPPTATGTVRVYYCRQTEKVVKPIGRITNISGDTLNYLSDYDNSADLNTTVGSNTNYFNVVDGRTGILKGTYQVNTYSTGVVEIDSTPTVTAVMNRTVSTSLDATIEINDYICPVGGSCVLYYPKPTANLVMQYAVAEIRRALGQDVGSEENAMKRMEKQLKSSWTGRESTRRVKRENKIWHKRRIY